MLGLIVTDTLFREYPDLPEGQLAKLRAAVVNMRALAGVARGLRLGDYVRLGKGEEGTGGRDKSSILADTLEAVLGAVYLDCGLAEADALVHRLFDPVIARSARLGAGLDWKTSLQELTAAGDPRRTRVPRGRERARPPEVVPRRRCGSAGSSYGAGRGPLQEGSRAAGRRGGLDAISARLPRPTPLPERRRTRRGAGAGPGRSRRRRGDAGQVDQPARGRQRRPADAEASVPELPEVEIVRRGLERHVVGRTIAAVQVLHPRAVRRHLAGAGDFAAAVQRPAVIGGARRRGKYLWLPVGDDAAARPPRHERPAAGRRRRPPAVPHVRARFTFTDGGPDLRFIDQRTFGHLSFAPRRGGAAGRDRAHRARPAGASLRHWRFVGPAPGPARPGSSAPCSTSRLVSGIGNIYADEALWRARLHWARPSETLTPVRARAAVRGGQEVFADALRAGGTSFDSLYVNVNGQSGYFERSLAVYGREGEPCPRCGDARAPRPVHEPLVLQLPGLPAAAATGPVVAAGRRWLGRYCCDQPGCCG